MQSTSFDFNNVKLLSSFLNYEMPRFEITRECEATSIRQINEQLSEHYGINDLKVKSIEASADGVTKKSSCILQCYSCKSTTSRKISDIQAIGYVCKSCNGRKTWTKNGVADAIKSKVEHQGGTILEIVYPVGATDDKVNTQNVKVYCQCHCGYGTRKTWPISFQNLQRDRWCPECAGNYSRGDKYLDDLNKLNPDWKFSKLDDRPLTNSSNVLGVCSKHFNPDRLWKPRVADLLKKDKPKGCGACNGCDKASLDEQFMKAQQACTRGANYTLIDEPYGELAGVYTTYPINCKIHGRSDKWKVPFAIELQKIIYEKYPRQCPLCSKELRNQTKLLNNLITLDCDEARSQVDLYVVQFEHKRIGTFYKVGIARNFNNRYGDTALSKDDLKIKEVIQIGRYPDVITIFTEKWMLSNSRYEKNRLTEEQIQSLMKNSKGRNETFKIDITRPSLECQVENMLSDQCFWISLNKDKAETLMSKARDVWEHFKSSIPAAH
jgi:hypothetical protein